MVNISENVQTLGAGRQVRNVHPRVSPRRVLHGHVAIVVTEDAARGRVVRVAGSSLRCTFSAIHEELTLQICEEKTTSFFLSLFLIQNDQPTPSGE